MLFLLFAVKERATIFWNWKFLIWLYLVKRYCSDSRKQRRQSTANVHNYLSRYWKSSTIEHSWHEKEVCYYDALFLQMNTFAFTEECDFKSLLNDKFFILPLYLYRFVKQSNINKISHTVEDNDQSLETIFGCVLPDLIFPSVQRRLFLKTF